MESYSKVGMQELDQRLSKIVEAARKKPVSVYRHGKRAMAERDG